MKKPIEASWPASKTEMWALERIKPYDKNPRDHSPEQIDLIARSMLDDGVTAPILVDEEGVIIYGHGRRMAAEKNAFKQYPVVVARGWSEQKKRAYRIKDNSLALISTWAPALLHGEVTLLKQEGYEMADLGFDSFQLAGYLTPPGKPAADPEAIPEPPKNPSVRRGDVWVLGNHRIVVGDATLPETWKELFGRDKAALVFTDPPYGVSYEAASGKFGVIEGDHKRRDDLYKMLTASLREMARHATDSAAFYIWHASSTREDFAQAMKAVGIVEKQYLMWVKPAHVFGRADYQWQHEPCFYASKAEHSPEFYGKRTETTVWHVQMVSAKETAATVGNGLILLDGEGASLYVQSKAPKNKKLRQVRITKDTSVYLTGSERQDGTVWEVARDPNHEHPTQKPVELARRAIENSSKPGEIVTDGFLGSGTTLIGAEMTARRCFATEIDPVYAEVAIRRWERFTGDQARLEATDQTLDEVVKARRKKDAAGNTRKPLSGDRPGRNGSKHSVRKGRDAGQPARGRKPTRVAPALAGDT
jgi:DNA modification methylase